MKRAWLMLLALFATPAWADRGHSSPAMMDSLDQRLDTWSGNAPCSAADLAKYEMSPENEYWFGRGVADQVLARYLPQGQAPLIYEPDSPAALYLNEVGQAVVAGAMLDRDEGLEGDPRNPRRFPSWSRADAVADRPLPVQGFHFILVHDAEPDAFGLPGGFIILSDGLVMRAGSEEQLAGVIAHEVAHVVRGHGVEVVKQLLCRQRGNILKTTGATAHQLNDDYFKKLGFSLDQALAAMDRATQALLEQLTQKGYGVKYELEADAYGTRYLREAGYSVLGIADYLHRTAADPTMKTGTTLTHPPSQMRFDHILQQVAMEHLEAEARSSHEVDRNVRFVRAMVESGLRPDWKPALDAARPAPAEPPVRSKRGKRGKG